jgi:hypothetical protein
MPSKSDMTVTLRCGSWSALRSPIISVKCVLIKGGCLNFRGAGFIIAHAAGWVLFSERQGDQGTIGPHLTHISNQGEASLSAVYEYRDSRR